MKIRARSCRRMTANGDKCREISDRDNYFDYSVEG
jgi:hypothetical protein